MTIIKLEPEINGAHQGQTGNFETIPEGWAVLSDEFISTWNIYKPFVQIYHVNSTIFAIEPIPLPETTIEDLRVTKINALSDDTRNLIEAGIDVTTSYGDEHFSLDIYDQINISNFSIMLAMGKQAFPYHADGKACVLYPAADLQQIVLKATEFITYCTTYNNLLREWIVRESDIDVINSIQLGIELPEDLQEKLNAILQAASA